MLMWGEGEHTTVTVMASGVGQEQLLAFAESLQPAAEGWSAFPAPCRASRSLFDGDPDAAMGYGGPSWQLGYRGPEDLSQPQDPSITVSAREGHRAMPSSCSRALRTIPTGVGREPTGHLPAGIPRPTVRRPYCTLVWIDEASGLVMTMNALGVSRERHDLVRRQHALGQPDAEWQKTVADVLPKPDEPTGPVEPPVPTQPIGFPNLAAGTLPDGRAWTINATRTATQPDGQPRVRRPHVRRIERHARRRVRQRRRVAASRHLDRHRRRRRCSSARRRASATSVSIEQTGRRPDHGADRRVERRLDRAPLVRRRGRRLEEGDGDRRPRRQRRRGVPPLAAARSAVSRLRGARQGAEA